MSGADEESRDVVVVTDLQPCRIVILERVALDLALRRVLKLFPLLSTHALYWWIRPELLHDRNLPLDERFQELGMRILSDFHHRQLIVSPRVELKMAAAAHILCC